ncbi:MAG: 50S ribosomal protein L4 [Methanobacteriota archaeon]|nr:MAG: 50S ribosomal protein L4 [Euryarchaeota archaeon]
MVSVLNMKGNKTRKKIELPPVFETEYRPDVIRRAVLSEQTKQKQPQGRYPLAGRIVAASSLGPGRAMAKIPRTHGSGTPSAGRGAFVHSTVGGKLLFPPTPEKIIVEKINKKEHRLALKSAIAATKERAYVEQRGHKINEKVQFPLIIEEKFTELSKTAEVKAVLENLGLGPDLERCQVKKIRAGKGKRRGRKYRRKVGPLIVVTQECPLSKAAKNIPGVEVIELRHMRVEKLAPGGDPARLTVWTEEAIKKLEEME